MATVTRRSPDVRDVRLTLWKARLRLPKFESFGSFEETSTSLTWLCEQPDCAFPSLSHLARPRRLSASLPTRRANPIYTMLCYTIQYYIYSPVPYSTILYYAILYYTILYYTILYYTILYYTILYYPPFLVSPEVVAAHPDARRVGHRGTQQVTRSQIRNKHEHQQTTINQTRQQQSNTHTSTHNKSHRSQSGVCQKNTPPEKRTCGKLRDFSPKHEIGGWRTVSAAVLQGKGSRERNLFLTDIGIIAFTSQRAGLRTLARGCREWGASA